MTKTSKKSASGVSTSVSKKSPKQKGKRSVVFSNISLNREDVKAIQASEITVDELEAWYFRMIDSDYKMSLGFNARSDSYICSATGQHPDEINYMVCLTAHGASPHKAIIALRYKIEHLCYEGEFPVDNDDFHMGGYR